MASFKEMQKDGTIKRADKSLARYADIYVKPGFNLRDMNDPDFEADLADLERHMAAGGKVPALEVVPREAGGVELVDGHRRHIVYGRLIEKGHPIEWIAIEQFIGNDIQRKARVLTSQEGRKLKPLEIAEGYRQLAAFGVSSDDIARMVHKSRQHVDQMLILATAPHAVHQAVKVGEISATDATKMARKEGDNAGAALETAREKAKAQGAKKITAGVTKQWTPPAKLVTPMVEALDEVLSSVPMDVRKMLTSGNAEIDNPDVVVTIPAALLVGLFNRRGEIMEAEDKARERMHNKAAKAKQMAIPETDGA